MLSNSSFPVAELKGEVLDKSAKKSPDFTKFTRLVAVNQNDLLLGNAFENLPGGFKIISSIRLYKIVQKWIDGLDKTTLKFSKPYSKQQAQLDVRPGYHDFWKYISTFDKKFLSWAKFKEVSCFVITVHKLKPKKQEEQKRRIFI